MNYVLVRFGEIVMTELPKTGMLKDGSTVSGYHLLDEEILLDEGWLPLEDIKPEYDIETEYLSNDGYEILGDKIIKKYNILPIEVVEEQPHIDTVKLLNILLGVEE